MESETEYLSRTQLATPANSPRIIEDAIGSTADQVFFDLEDSLHASEKVEGRTNLIEAVKTRDWQGKPLRYRINSVRTRWWYDDVIRVVEEVGGSIEGLILPKVQTPVDVETVVNLLRQVEVNTGLEPGKIGVSVQIEDATGMGNAENIVGASDRLDAVIFGPGDYSASIESKGQVLGAETEYPGHYWHYPLSRISQAAASADLLAIDGLYTNVDDIEGFRKTCTYARMLGYDGKWVIHPEQTRVANDVFAPTDEEIEQATSVVRAYENADENAIPTVDGRVIDEETVNMARHVLRKARLAGVLD